MVAGILWLWLVFEGEGRCVCERGCSRTFAGVLPYVRKSQCAACGTRSGNTCWCKAGQGHTLWLLSGTLGLLCSSTLTSGCTLQGPAGTRSTDCRGQGHAPFQPPPGCHPVPDQQPRSCGSSPKSLHCDASPDVSLRTGHPIAADSAAAVGALQAARGMSSLPLHTAKKCKARCMHSSV